MHITNVIKVGVCSLLLVFATNTYAYETTGQAMYTLNDSLALYTVGYEFGFLNADLWMPITAVRENQTETTKPLVSYAFMTPQAETAWSGVSHAIVVSDAVVKNGYYFVPAGERANFTLLVLYQPVGTTGESVSLQVTELAGLIKKDGELSRVQVTPEELEQYQTPAL